MTGKIASERRVTDLALQQDERIAAPFLINCVLGLQWYAEDSPNPGWGTEEERWIVYPADFEFAEDPSDDDESQAQFATTATSRELIAVLASVGIADWGPVHWGLAKALTVRHADLVSALITGDIIPEARAMVEQVRAHTHRTR